MSDKMEQKDLDSESNLESQKENQGSKSSRKRKAYSIEKKLEAVDYTNKYSKSSASKKAELHLCALVIKEALLNVALDTFNKTDKRVVPTHVCKVLLLADRFFVEQAIKRYTGLPRPEDKMSDLRAGIVRLWEEGKKQSGIARDMNVPKQTVSDAIKRFRETGRNEDRARNGRPATATTPENIRKIKKKSVIATVTKRAHPQQEEFGQENGKATGSRTIDTIQERRTRAF